MLKSVDGTGLSEETIAKIQPFVQVNPNHGHIYQAKIVTFFLDESIARRDTTKGTNNAEV